MEVVCLKGLYYTLLNDNEAVVGLQNYVNSNALTNKSATGEVIIPNIIEINNKFYSVIEIGSYSFRGCIVNKFIIQEGIMVINDRAFNECNELVEIQVPSSVHTLGPYCVDRNEKLQKIIIMPFSNLINISTSCLGSNKALKVLYFCSRNFESNKSLLSGTN